MAESRLRAARIWSSRPDLSTPVFDIEADGGIASLSKEVWDPASGEFSTVETWTLYAFEVGGTRLSFPVDRTRAAVLMNAFVDRFILDYLRVNEEACQ